MSQKKKIIPSGYTGQKLLNHSLFNKGSAFTKKERQTFKLEGLLPSRISTIEDQKTRMYKEISRKANPLEKHIGLVALKNRNETLFYRVLSDHLHEFMPIVYTPTVGLACQRFSHIFRKVRGLWITPEHKGHIAQTLTNSPYTDIRLIVATDNERILGLGDQGAGGMPIPDGKLALYVVAAGIDPAKTLPISLDVGTDNQDLLNDPMYLGWRNARLKGKEYNDLIEEFVHAVRDIFPEAVLQWEDFKKEHGFELLRKYQKTVPSFNDDIQGTASVALACLLTACRKTKQALSEQRVFIIGAGAAGTGIGELLRTHLPENQVAFFDSRGLMVEDASHPDEAHLCWSVDTLKKYGIDKQDKTDMLSFVKKFKPSVIIGTSGQPGLIDQNIVEFMATYMEHPIIFPFSNPTHKSEASPADLYKWTKGKAMVATGSPFDDVTFNKETYPVSQGNNAFIFPGVGLGAILAQAREITDSMLYVAAQALESFTNNLNGHEKELLPSVDHLREVSCEIALAVWKQADQDQVAKKAFDAKKAKIKMDDFMWSPDYLEYIPE